MKQISIIIAAVFMAAFMSGCSSFPKEAKTEDERWLLGWQQAYRADNPKDNRPVDRQTQADLYFRIYDCKKIGDKTFVLVDQRGEYVWVEINYL